MNAWWAMARELTSPFTLGLIAFCVVGALLYVSRRRRWARASRPASSPFPPVADAFARGFDLLLDGRWPEAIALLKETVRKDPDRVLEYLELGKLFRRRDDPRRAARLFEQVLVRRELGCDERVMALYELGLSYHAMGLPEHAVRTLEQGLQLMPAHSEARRELRRIYEEMGQWDKAVAVERVRLKRGEATDAQTLAALRTQQAKAAWAAGKLRDSTAHLRAALALDPDCTEAMLVLGRLLSRQGKPRRALRVWKSLMQRRPEFLYLTFRDMQTAFGAVKSDVEWESFLRRFIERYPHDPTGQLALAEWHETHGRANEAVACLQRALEVDPLCREAHLALLALYRERDMASDVLIAYERLVQSATWLSCARFRCRACGYRSDDPFWKCPACAIWTTPYRVMPPPSSVALTAGDVGPSRSVASPDAVPVVVARPAPAESPSER
ncbi:MAG TPA: tetratricopeptide repeat protein [Alphaproteobacteria bacterium]|nr:tetratricopeptide repeat protein [Alphaproteobacteria bacterium]